jgi:hypothetical protein
LSSVEAFCTDQALDDRGRQLVLTLGSDEGGEAGDGDEGTARASPRPGIPTRGYHVSAEAGSSARDH